MRTARFCPTVGIVGAGAAGCLTAAHLAVAATASRRDLDVLLLDPRPSTGRGTAYSTRDPRHRLNVPTAGMSAWPDDPEHFLRWRRAERDPGARPGDFAPRADYGTYLAAALDEAVGRSRGRVRLERRYERATGLQPHGRRVRLGLGETGARSVDAAVLAIGASPPGTAWAPDTLVRSPRFVADPWAPGALSRVDPVAPVLLVGTGLTMVDIALTLDLPGRTLHAVSRHGLLPAVHADTPLPAYPPPALPSGPLSLADLRAAVCAHIGAAEAALGDWRPAIDSLRPLTAAVWGRLSDGERAGFLRGSARQWEIRRHRLPPDVGRQIAGLRQDGLLTVLAGEVLAAIDSGDVLTVMLADGTELRAGSVVNCTGPTMDLRGSADPLVLELLTEGTARPGPLGWGVDTDDAGRVLDAGGAASPVVWTLGATRRGQLWETTAIPEIRAQAAVVAAGILESLPRPTRVVGPRDPYGLALSTNAAAAEAYSEGLGRVLRLQAGADGAFRDATALDPGFALGHAGLALLGHEWGAEVDVGAALAAARRAVRCHGDERERSFVAAVTARIRGDDPGAALLGHIAAYPEDALAVSIAVPTIAFAGATELPSQGWSLVEGLAPTYGDDWWYSGLLAFVRQEQERWDEAATLSEQALAVEPASGHAVHARAHVYYETGEHEHGLAFLDAWIVSCGLGVVHRAHFSWHAALHELALGEDEAVQRRYFRELAPTQVQDVRALIDSASLLWRCDLAGAWDGRVPILDVVSAVDPRLLWTPPTPFVAMHAAVALTAAADAAGLSRLRAYAGSQPDPLFPAVVEPLTGALVDLVEGRCAAAAETLWCLRDRLSRLGGSAAQREIVEDTLLFALVQAGRLDHARLVLQRRLDRRPSRRDTARLRRLDLPPSARSTPHP
ncbi:MAG TPA: FAD/NAD(P)-binding protein [Mycobacteriales bacterium]|nr:FAD/NAD(P)-binding protein [Mycobacteriales bacterium]